MWFCQIRPPCKSNYACTLDQVSFQSGLRIFEDNAVFVSTAGAPVVIIVQGVSIDPSIHPLQSKTGNDRRGFLKRGFLKGIYRLNLIFWIVMGCGIARFGRKGLKTTETWKFWSQILSPGVLRRCPSRSLVIRWDLEGQRQMINHWSLWDQNFQVSVVFRPFRPKRAIPHPITIQNMRFRR